jgi:hypothetical protein
MMSLRASGENKTPCIGDCWRIEGEPDSKSEYVLRVCRDEEDDESDDLEDDEE